MKTVYLAILYVDDANDNKPNLFGTTLIFSNGADTMVYQGYGKEKVRVGDIFTHPMNVYLPIRVREDFEQMDFIPENY